MVQTGRYIVINIKQYWTKFIIICFIIGSVFWCNLITEAKGKKDKEIYNYYQLFADVYDKIVHYYVDETSPTVLIEGAIRGMLEILDRNNFYLSDEQMKNDLKNTVLLNQFGLILGVKQEKLLVITTIPGSSAYEAELQSGDWIWSIGDTLIGTTPSLMEDYRLLLENQDRVFGKSEQNVTIIQTDNEPDGEISEEVENRSSSGENENLDENELGLNISFLRGENLEIYKRVQMKPITQKSNTENEYIHLGDSQDIIYIRPCQISSCLDFQNFIHTSGINDQDTGKSLIIDLRQIYTIDCLTAIEIAYLFLPADIIASSIHYFNNKTPKPFLTNHNGPFSEINLAILIDNGTAGGAEVLAAALAGQNNCVTYGQKTFGYAFSRVEIPTSSGGMMSIIEGVFHTPEGKPLYPDSLMPLQPFDETINPHDWHLKITERKQKDPLLEYVMTQFGATMSVARKEVIQENASIPE